MRWMEMGEEERENKKKRPEDQEAKDRIETWPDSATQRSLDHSKPFPVYSAGCLSLNSFFNLCDFS